MSKGRSSYTKELETQDPKPFPGRGTRGFQAYTTASWNRERMQKMPTFLCKVENESTAIFNPKLAENAKQMAPKVVCQKLWKAAGALGASCPSSAPSNLLFAFKNIPTDVEAQFRVILSLSPASLAWNMVTHVHSASCPARNHKESKRQ